MGLHVDLGHVDLGHVDVGHVDIPPPHIDIGHVDLGHVDAGHVDVGHIDLGHVDAGHVDVGHVDLGHVDAGHVDIGHVDLGHIDVRPPHIDIGHVDLVPHIDVGFPTVPSGAAPPHVDTAPAHADAGYNHWWQNWPKTHGYVAKKMFFPTSVDEVATAVRTAESDQVPLRAVGGGWSFSDAALPGNVGPSLATVSATGRPDVTTVDTLAGALVLAEGFPSDEVSSIASVDASNGWLIGYDEQNVRLLGGARRHVPLLESNLTSPEPQPAYLVNTRSLKSTLQTQLGGLLSAAATAATAPGPNRKFYFHVEAGITIEELGPLLDAQSPRLQLGASGGNPGATLAGTLSTATHGAELAAHGLLIDRVRAIHLVGPGGQQWWIEGAISVADPAKLIAAYPGLDAAHIITGTTPVNGLLPQDWLNAAVVSMGSMGVLYSVVIEVPARQGIQQVCTQTAWLGGGPITGQSILDVVKAQNPSLSALSSAQIVQVLRTPTDPNFSTVNLGIAKAMTSGAFSGGLVSDSASGQPNANQYADLAFNPNPAPKGLQTLALGDFDCWILNRRFLPNIPFDPQPPSTGGVGTIINDVFVSLARAFGINNNPGNLAHLVGRLADVYGLSTPFHVDLPLHIDIPSPHIDIPSPHIDVPPPHIDIPSPHVDVGSPHIDVASPHIDVGHVDLHIDTSILGNHIDVGFGHIDIPSPHVDIPSPHIDIPSPHIDVASPHIDVGHVDLDSAIAALENPLTGLVGAALGLIPAAVPIVQTLLLAGHDLSVIGNLISRIANASDTLDVALDALTTPMANANAVDLAQPFLTGLLASILGTGNDAKIGVAIGADVGAVGFPESGLLGAGIEVALPVGTAFGFLQSEILDKIPADKPFFGYVSVRICPQTTTLMGMQQWPTSVMIEVVSFGDPSGIDLIDQLQQNAVTFMAAGKDAMLHWGLENDQMTAAHLAAIPTLNAATVAHTPTPNLSKVAAFKAVRALIASNNGANPSTLFAAFDNAFTARLGL